MRRMGRKERKPGNRHGDVKTGMEEKTEIMARIREKYVCMSRGQRAIADYLLEHDDQAAFMTAAKLGERLSVSESTVVRFAAALGYKGYPQMQEALAGRLKRRLNTVESMDVSYAGMAQSEILTSVLTGDIEKIRHTIDHLDPAAFEMAVDLILEAETVYILGVRSCRPLAEFLSFYLGMIRGHVVQIGTTSTTEIFEQMLRIGEKDCLIGISFPRYSMRTLKAMEFANDRNARVIAITDSVHSPMNLYSSCNLLARSDMVSIVDSLVAPLSLINALVIALCLKRPGQVKQSLQSLEDAWNNYQVYLNDEINFINEETMFEKPFAKDPGEWKRNGSS